MYNRYICILATVKKAPVGTSSTIVILPESSTQTVHWLEDLYKHFHWHWKHFHWHWKKRFCAKQRGSFSGRQTDKGTDIEIEKGWSTHQRNRQNRKPTNRREHLTEEQTKQTKQTNSGMETGRSTHLAPSTFTISTPAGKNNNSSQRRWHPKIPNSRNRFCKWCGIFSFLAFAWWCCLMLALFCCPEYSILFANSTSAQ